MFSDEHPKSDTPSPGALLRAGRERAGMTIEQVAEKLHLLQSVVNQLEKDCYDRIRGETFVRGYMRNYARLLGIDADEVLVRYKGRADNARAEPRFARRRDGWHNSGGAGRVGMVAALLGLSVMFLFWNRTPSVQAAGIETDAITVETGRGEHVVPLDRVEEAHGR